MIKIKVDNRILFKGTAGDWQARPPDEFQDAIRPDAQPQPWFKAMAIALADVVMGSGSANITVKTRLGGVRRGWSMEVETL